VDDSIWRLPGPDRMLGQVAQEVRRGRHVAVVLPACRASEESFVDGLVSALMRTLTTAGEEPRRALITDPGENPVQCISRCLVFADEQPVVVADLLDHDDAAGMTAVLSCTGMARDQYSRMSNLLTRIALESRPRPAGRRPRIVIVGARHLLPRLQGGSTDVTFEAVWWWGRLTRWDVGSRLAPTFDAEPAEAVLRTVRLETVLEVCRWDLDLAEELAVSWDGDPGNLARTIEEVGKAQSRTQVVIDRPHRPAALRPDEDLLELWEDGHVDLWQDECCPSPYALLTLPGGVDHAVWAAQARVLLPWIDERRRQLLRHLVERYGNDAVTRVTASLNGTGQPPLEVGPLFEVVRRLVPPAQSGLRDAARQLMAGRNRLAHLQSLSLADQTSLAHACTVLDGRPGGAAGRAARIA
jgi:hypothetical protein